MKHRTVIWLTLLLCTSAGSQAAPSAKAVEDAAWKSFQDLKQFTAHGGYLWWYSTDGQLRAGEGSDLVERSVIWVQPPGTPTVGLALLRLYDATHDPRYLTAAAEAGEALAWGQLATGGWTAYIDFENKYGRPLHYRRDFENGDKKPGKRFDASSFDDDITQAAVRLLLELDARLKGTRPAITHALQYALDHILAAQFKNGGWPQCFDLELDRDRPDLPLTCPNPWPRERPGGRSYWYDYTINDDAMVNTIDTLLLAHRLTGDEKYSSRRSAPATGCWPPGCRTRTRSGRSSTTRRCGRPGPASGNPPTATTLETVGILQRLETLWLLTGDEKYRAPLQPALDWFRKVRRPDGTWSRYYELFTNRPSFMVLTGKKGVRADVR
ncbi:MAG: pectate lyase [Gammaproteobacteria bacterium]|nr:pectate lyase [Gammaproteobacteria bacterium]